MVMVEAKKTMAMAARRSFQSQLRFFKVHRSATMFDVVNPATGQTIAELPDDSAEEVAAKFGVLAAGQKRWKAVPLAERRVSFCIKDKKNCVYQKTSPTNCSES
jgi:acyl-CoA reductase-like NAD-dependent aldehyde dehydrogenase